MSIFVFNTISSLDNQFAVDPTCWREKSQFLIFLYLNFIRGATNEFFNAHLFYKLFSFQSIFGWISAADLQQFRIENMFFIVHSYKWSCLTRNFSNVRKSQTSTGDHHTYFKVRHAKSRKLSQAIKRNNFEFDMLSDINN